MFSHRFLCCLIFPSALSLLLLDHSQLTSGRQACQRHELYVSFSDLGWKVRCPLQAQAAPVL